MMSGALAGFTFGVPWAAAGLPAVEVVGALMIAAVALALDIAKMRPPAVHGQVPQAWGRVFPPTGAAALYGARLGVGPLTILASWQWWAMAAIGMSLGVWQSVGLGAVFGSTRVAATAIRSRALIAHR